MTTKRPTDLAKIKAGHSAKPLTVDSIVDGIVREDNREGKALVLKVIDEGHKPVAVVKSTQPKAMGPKKLGQMLGFTQ